MTAQPRSAAAAAITELIPTPTSRSSVVGGTACANVTVCSRPHLHLGSSSPRLASLLGTPHFGHALLRRLVRVWRAEQGQQIHIAEVVRVDVEHFAVDLWSHT